MDLYRGKIVAFRGSHLSGLGALVIDDEERGTVAVPCDNAPTVRALDGAFDNVIAPGHSVNPKGGHVGKKIYYSVDEFGVLLGFTPVEAAPEALVQAFIEERRA